MTTYGRIIKDGEAAAFVAVAGGAVPSGVSQNGVPCPLVPVRTTIDLVCGRNLLWNANFAEGPKGWDLLGKGDFRVGLDLNDRFTLNSGHTFYVRMSADEADKPGDLGARYVGADGTGLIPVVGGTRLCFKALVGLVRSTGFLEFKLLSAQGKILETVRQDLRRSTRIGGSDRTDYDSIVFDFDLPAPVAAVSLSVGLSAADLYEEEDRTESDLCLFLAEMQLFHVRGEQVTVGFPAQCVPSPELVAALGRGDQLFRVDHSAAGPLSLKGGPDVPVTAQPQELKGLIPHSNDNVFGYRFKPRPHDQGHHVLRFYVDGEMLALADVESDGDEDAVDALFVLPDSYMDGNPHTLEVEDAYGRLLAGEARVLGMIQTDWFDILRHSTPPHEGKLAPTAQMRYQALERALSRLADSDDPVRDAAEFHHAHQALVRGWAFLGEADYAALTFEAPRAPDVSVIIPVHNKPHMTYSCLAALRLAVCKADFEVIVVDDGSDAATGAMLANIAGIKLVRHARAKGFNGAVNAGAEQAKGRYIALLNNDTEVAASWLDELLWPFTHMDNVGLTGAKLIYPNGRLQEAGGLVNGEGEPFLYGRLKNAGDPRYNYTREVDYVSGAALLIDGDLWRSVDGLSAYLAPAYWEDVDLAFKVRGAGKRVVYAPKSLVIHHEGVSHGRDTKAEGTLKRYQDINAPKFRKTWKKALLAQHAVDADKDRVKDRGVKGRVLFLDNEVPRPDFDAGSYAALQEIRMFQKLGYKVTFLPANRAYLGHYVEDLERMGVEVLYKPFAKTVRQALHERSGQYDLVFVTRYYVARHFIDILRDTQPNAKILFNNADCHFLREMRAALVKKDAADRAAALMEARKIREDELAVMRSVDLNFSYNASEIEVLNTHLMGEVPVAKLPWVQEVVEDVPPLVDREGIMFLGGFGHKPNVEAIHYLAEDVMPRLAEVAPDIVLYVYGSRTTDEIRALEADNIRIMGQIPNLKDAYDKHRIFVAPLLSGAGIKGKVLGAMAHGMPCIVSPVAAEGTGITDGVDAHVVAGVDALVETVERLYGDEGALNTLSHAARAFIDRDYGLEAGVTALGQAVDALDQP